MMALDAKTIKEEIPDKDAYDSSSASSVRRIKGKDQCRTPDSPESARAVAPRSPISPQIHHTSLAPLRSSRNGSSSPVINGSTGPSTPPPAVPATTPVSTVPSSIITQDTTRTLLKIRRFLGALVQFGQDSGIDVGDRVRSLVLSLTSGGLTPEEFKIALQEATNFPVRPNVLPFLRAHIPFLQREVSTLARASNQSSLQYVRANENCVLEFAHNPTEHSDIFLPIEGITTSCNASSMNGNGVVLKRRGSENLFDTHSNGPHDWNDYVLPSKRAAHHSMLLSSNGVGQQIFSSHPPLFDYQSHHVESFIEKQPSHRDDRDIRGMSTESAHRGNGPASNNRNGVVIGSNSMNSSSSGGDEEWKNIHTMLNCISAMVDKTKRAITILQQRGAESQQHTSLYPDTALSDIKRQTEEKVAEFRRNAEDAVNQVKRQAVIEIQRAVASAESRAVEIMTQERLKMEKIYAEMNKTNSDIIDNDSQSPSIPPSQNVCWNCGRKANETCSGCTVARYCGSFCQHKDWEQHHQVCGTTRGESGAVQKHLTSTQPRPPMIHRSSPPQHVTQQNSTPLTNGQVVTTPSVK